MTKPYTKEQQHLKRHQRLKSKSLQQVLTYRFLNHYGYDKGEITVKAIVDDIISLMENYFLLSPKSDDMQFLNYGYLTWMAVPVDEYPQRGKTIAATRRSNPFYYPLLPTRILPILPMASTPNHYAKRNFSAGSIRPSIREPC